MGGRNDVIYITRAFRGEEFPWFKGSRMTLCVRLADDSLCLSVILRIIWPSGSWGGRWLSCYQKMIE